ncbi:MAG: hypothetical protein A2W93_08250 [Bacteroidetes bacterium GWF2_43_63]|nr:MAG: hypothetical protein A2W94_04905 [Bacteroidetes bacterium GWE2_42_42]OFY55601.1 MAG: hypothetical protein A2W93_08250 [Bacteroidetes bacterium GWF2_43_63]HBG71619.1 hypothetical protein [Bacteroidales bacterium]HCB62152.1 hypothetical protein [Bacteroidales bacterium]HCY22380.1 hypothetical protein [Bacteroidales bacterium]
MKKILTLLGTIIFVAMFTPMFFTSCETEEDTEVPEPNSTFFSAVIGENNKSITPGVNGYLVEPYDTGYSDASGDHYITGIRLYQSASGYYVSSREEFKIELVNLFDTLGLDKDSIFHAFLSQATLPWYNPTMVADSVYHTGMRIMWRTAEGDWYASDEATQSASLTVDTTHNVTVPGGISTHELYLQYNCTLFEKNGSGTVILTDGRGRFSFINSMFY